MVGLHKNPEVMNGDSDDDSDDDNNTLRPQRRVPATSNFHSANQDDSSLVVKGILIGDFTSIYVKCYFVLFYQPVFHWCWKRQYDSFLCKKI